MNKERFHNELAMRLGYERLLNDKRITIAIEESEEPWVTLKIQGNNDIKLNVSQPEEISLDSLPEMQDELNMITDAVHQAYLESLKQF